MEGGRVRVAAGRGRRFPTAVSGHCRGLSGCRRLWPGWLPARCSLAALPPLTNPQYDYPKLWLRALRLLRHSARWQSAHCYPHTIPPSPCPPHLAPHTIPRIMPTC